MNPGLDKQISFSELLTFAKYQKSSQKSSISEKQKGTGKILSLPAQLRAENAHQIGCYHLPQQNVLAASSHGGEKMQTDREMKKEFLSCRSTAGTGQRVSSG